MIEGKLSKEDSKYLKTAARLLRQGNTMLKQLSERVEIEDVSTVALSMHNEIEAALEKIDSIQDYVAAGKYVQLSLMFNEDER